MKKVEKSDEIKSKYAVSQNTKTGEIEGSRWPKIASDTGIYEAIYNAFHKSDH